MLAQLREDFPQDLRLVYRQYPLEIHDKAAQATLASEAAGRQGKFWEMHDLLYVNQQEWAELTPQDFETWLLEQAETLDLDGEQFAGDLADAELADRLQEAIDEAAEVGVQYTPFLLVNGQRFPLELYNSLGNIYLALSQQIVLQTLADRQFSECPAITIDPLKQYSATLRTEKGDIVIELFAEEAPFTVNNFIFLAENDWYDNVTFHRVIPDFVAQAGDPSGTGMGGPGYAFGIEIHPDLSFDRAGLLAMANAGPEANGSQFFITYAPAEHLNGGFTIFGEVIEGMDVVEQLTPRDPSQGMGGPPGDVILDVIIEEK